MEQKHSHVYIISHIDGDRFKIGKANRVRQRIKRLDLTDKLDYSKCYVCTMPKEQVFAFEKALHYMFGAHQMENLPKTDGYTEFFCQSMFNEALEAAKELCELRGLKIKPLTAPAGVVIDLVEPVPAPIYRPVDKSTGATVEFGQKLLNELFDNVRIK